MYEIKKAIIRIDLEEYADNLWRYPGQIDCASCNREANEVTLVDSYDDLECAEANIDRTVYVTIDDQNVTLAYEFIAGEETVYFNHAKFNDNVYPCDDTFFSNECYSVISNCLSLREKTLTALEQFEEEHGRLDRDDTVYVWSWFEDGQRKVRISDTNHSPEGVATEVFTLGDIDTWWNNEWNQKP